MKHTRINAGGGSTFTMSYIDELTATRLADDLFGHNGWTRELRGLTMDYCDQSQDFNSTNGGGGNGSDGSGSGSGIYFSIGVTATVRIILKDGSFHEDVGFGHVENMRSTSRKMALLKSEQDAIADAFKRTLRQFGGLAGNCLYNSQYCRQVNRVLGAG